MRRAPTGLFALLGLGALVLLASSGTAPASASAGHAKNKPKEQPKPASSPSPTPAARGPSPFGQKDIVDAIEASVTGGNVTPLATITRRVGELPGPLQAYLVAASRRATAYHKDIAQFIREFNAKEVAAAAKRLEDMKAGLGVAGAAAAAVNVIPVIGQAVSAILTLSVAVAAAILEGEKLPARLARDQIRDAYEGQTIYAGIGESPSPENPFIDSYLGVKQAVVQDSVAIELPNVPLKTAFAWAPTYADFTEAAHELGLYSVDKKETSNG